MDEGREATPEETRTISAYSGWGGAANAFAQNPTGGWAAVSQELKELLSEDEFAEQRATVLTAFYTPRPVVELIWETLRGAGICDEGTAEILEPGCGTGNFMRCVPEGMDVHVTGVEIDPVSAGLARVLCPDHTIVAADIAKCEIPDGSFDAAIGNVPYSDAIKIDGVPLHDYMIRRSVAAVRPGGIVAVLTSRYTMDKARETTRENLARECDLIGMARLPKETFESQAGTSALCDLVILRKLAEPREISRDNAPAWVHTAMNADGFRVNSELAGNPSIAVGDQGSEMTAYGPGYSLNSGLDAAGIADGARKALADQAISTTAHTFEGMPGRSAAPEVAQIPTDPALYEFTLGDGGSIWYGNGDTVERFHPAGRGAEDRAREMQKAADHGVSIVLGTIGEDGSYVLYNGKTYYASAVHADDVIDTMGAGDSYFAAFLCSLLKSSKSGALLEGTEEENAAHLQKAMQIGAAFAAKMCAKEGAFGYGTPIVGRTEL